MEYFAAKQLVKPLVVAEKGRLKKEYGPYLVSGARAVLVLFPEGRMLSQELKGSGFRIWFHDFFIERAVSVFAVSQQPLRVLHYALAGDLKVAPIKDEMYLLPEGQYSLLKMPPKVEQVFFLAPGVSRIFQVDFIVADLDHVTALSGLYYRLDRANAVVSCGLTDYRVKTVIGMIRENQITHATEQDFFLSGRILDLLQRYVHHLFIKSQSSGYSSYQKMEAIQDYILTHLETPLTVGVLCQQFHITKGVLQKYFKEYTQLSIHGYILEQRMAYGLFLLQCGEKQVSEIALLTGYEDISGFRRAFKSYFGFSPSHVAGYRN